MKITFGILTNDNKECKYIKNTIDSIYRQNIPKEDYEIIICSRYKLNLPKYNCKIILNIIHLTKSKKRHFILNKSSKDYILFLKDYHTLDYQNSNDNWYQNIKSYDSNVILSKILYSKTNRYYDLCLGDKNKLKLNISNGILLPYHIVNDSELLEKLNVYVTGVIFLFKKSSLPNELFKNTYLGKEITDVDFCNIFFNHIKYKINFSEKNIIHIDTKKKVIKKGKGKKAQKFLNRCRLIDIN